MECNQYLEKCIRGRNKEISKMYERIEELKAYNRRDRNTIEDNQRQEMEFLRDEFLKKISLDEIDDTRGVYVIFNNKLEYVDTITIESFSEFIKDNVEYEKFNTVTDALESYLRANKLYANSAKYFIGKPLKWYTKPFKDMLLSFGGWKVDENGLLTDVLW